MHPSHIQNVSFKSLDEFWEFLPDDELRMAELLRQMVMASLPNCTEKLSYNVPYYKVHKNVCFIWPASIFWGAHKTFEGLRFGFCNGYLLHDESNYLDKGNRKQVYWKDFASIKDIDVDLLKSYLYEAAIIDGQVKK
jgi:hypothetical protein